MRNLLAYELDQRSRGVEAVDHAQGVCAIEDASTYHAWWVISVVDPAIGTAQM